MPAGYMSAGVASPAKTVLQGLSEVSRNETIVGSSESLARLARLLRAFQVLSLARIFEALAFAVWL
eukprot:459229-Prorocentrum_minimum.AAC.1